MGVEPLAMEAHPGVDIGHQAMNELRIGPDIDRHPLKLAEQVDGLLQERGGLRRGLTDFLPGFLYLAADDENGRNRAKDEDREGHHHDHGCHLRDDLNPDRHHARLLGTRVN